MTATTPTLSSQYDPSDTEAKWQQFWEKHQVFKADPDRGGSPFCVVIPPPNVTGSLHMGHAFEHTLIDTIVRYQRMRGRNTLWLPGTDHASIAVQTILEKELKDQGKSRETVGREKFLERAWEWKAESGGKIVGQLRQLGVSVDWRRERFTMDEGLSQAVLTAFNRLYEEGLIYRGNYMVNWCPASQSAVSDLEVENQEVDGHLWHLRYPLSDESGYVEVATTRPETMLGDTAVAVNPNDQRYADLVGKTVTLPLLEREIPIIADEFVDAEFGTGCVKVTPAHDPNDFAMGQRHELPMINILNKDGSLNQNAGVFAGMDRFEARQAVVAALDEAGFLVRIEAYRHSLPYSDRGKVPVEPLLSTQWFVKIRPMADKALDFLDHQQSPQFVPDRWTKVYRDWLVNLRDWCISRQLWWGHQIPAWYVVSETEGNITDSTPYFVAMTAAEARAKAVEQFGEGVRLEQDPDVLDTWFSSGLWPMSTLGWPDESAPDFQTYYPTSTLVTGFDIIFFWVARMTMMAGHFTDQMPFETVYIHGLVRDENNQKMSKSKGNGIDPLVLVDKYGTDALRYTLVREVAGAGQDIRLDYNRKTDESAAVEASRNFTNKLWNASRFVMMNLEGQTPAELGDPTVGKSVTDLPLADRWILSRYYRTVETVRQQLDQYGMGEAAKELYEFIWGDFCDWYIELAKPRLYGDGGAKTIAQQTLAFVLEGSLKLLHPFVPHITEELWHTLTQTGYEDSLAQQAYPSVRTDLIDPTLERQFNLLIDVVRTIRNLRAEAGIKPSAQIEAQLNTDSPQEADILAATRDYIQDLAKVETLTTTGPAGSATATGPDPTPAPSSEGFAMPDFELAQFSEFAQDLLARPQAYFRRLSGFRGPATLLLILLGVVVTINVVAAILRTVDSIPGLAGLFQLIGLGYGLWFGIRYLNAQNRREIATNLQNFWTEITGKKRLRRLPPAEPMAQLPPAEPAAATAPEPGIAEMPETPGAAEPEPESEPEPTQMFAGVTGTVQVLIPLSGVVDVAALRAKIEKDLGKAEGEIKSLRGRLKNSGFVNQAPAEVVQSARESLAEAEKQAELLRTRLAML